jgi:integrase
VIKKKLTKQGEARYEVRLRRPDGREYSKTFRTRREAKNFEASERATRANGSWVDPTAGRVTFDEWANEWLATCGHTWRLRTADKHRMAIEVHWRPRLGQRSLRSISPAEIQRAVNDLAAIYRPASVRTYYGTLRSCLKLAVDREVLARTPCRSIKLPAAAHDEKRLVSPQELHRLADEAGLRWRCFIYLGGVTGLRFGEVAALRRRDIDLERPEVSIVQTLTELNGEVTIGWPKSPASIRAVPLPAPLVAELTAHIDRCDITDPDDLLFVNRFGKPIRRSDFRRAVFVPAVERAGLNGFTFHGLRHSAATNWVASGIDVRTVQAWLGHADPHLVLRLYAHASNTAGRLAAEVVAEKFWEQTTAPGSTPDSEVASPAGQASPKHVAKGSNDDDHK